MRIIQLYICVIITAELFLVRVFLHSDWIRKDTEYLSVFSPNAGKCGPEITRYLDTFHSVHTLYLYIIHCINNIRSTILLQYLVRISYSFFPSSKIKNIVVLFTQLRVPVKINIQCYFRSVSSTCCLLDLKQLFPNFPLKFLKRRKVSVSFVDTELWCGR